jgi:hypothetical protein
MFIKKFDSKETNKKLEKDIAAAIKNLK